jgi:hypothetical protein
MSVTLCPRRLYLYLGLICLAAFFVCGCLSALGVSGNAPAQSGIDARATTMLGLMAAGSGFVGGMLSAAYLLRVTLSDTQIVIASIVARHEFDESRIKRLLWTKRGRGNRIRIEAITSSTSLEIGVFSNQDQLQIMRHLRRLVPESNQCEWETFCHHVATPLREGQNPRPPGVVPFDSLSLPESARVFVTRQRYDRFFALLLVPSTILATGIRWIFGKSEAIALLILLVFFWMLLRFNVPLEGKWDARWTATKERRIVGLVHLAMPLAFLAALGLKLLGLNKNIALCFVMALRLPATG